MECKNCGLNIQDSYLYCPNCGSPSYSSLYSELIKIDYFLSEFDTWLEESLVEREAVLPIKERYLAKKQEILALLQSSNEAAPPLQEEDVFRELKEKVVEDSFDKAKKLFEEKLRELDEAFNQTPPAPGADLHPSTPPETEEPIEEKDQDVIEEEISLDSLDLKFSPPGEEKSEKPPASAPREVSSAPSGPPKAKIFLSSRPVEEPYAASPSGEISLPAAGGSLTSEQVIVIFFTIAGVFSIFFFSLHLPLPYYAPFAMLVGAAAALTGYYLTLNTQPSKRPLYLWKHPLTLMGYALTFLALGLSLKGLIPGVIAVTLTLATILYIISAYVYKSPFFVYLSALAFSFLYLVALSQVISFVRGEGFEWFPLSLPATCFTFIPLTVLAASLARQFSVLENGKLSRPLYRVAFVLSLAILLVTFGMLYVGEEAGDLEMPGGVGTYSVKVPGDTPLLQTLFFPSRVAFYQIAWTLAIFLTYSGLYAICSYLYKRTVFIYLTNLLLTLSVGTWVSYLGVGSLLPLSLGLLFLAQFAGIQLLESSGVSRSYLTPILDVSLGTSLIALGLLLTDGGPAFFKVVAFLLLGTFYLLATQIYPNRFLVYLALGVLTAGGFYAASFLGKSTNEGYGLIGSLLSLTYFFGAYFYEKNLQLKVDLDLHGEEISTWQKKMDLYFYPVLNSAIMVSILAFLMTRNNPLVLILLGSFYLLLILVYPSKYWMYPAGVLYIGSIYFGWIIQLPVKSWDFAAIVMAMTLFMLAYAVQVNRRALSQAFSLVEQDYHQPLFNLSILLFGISLSLYFWELLFTEFASNFYTLLLATLFCGLGFYLKGEAVYLILLFMITFALNFSFWTTSLREINFGYLSLSSSLLTLGWMGITYLITRPSGNQVLEKLGLSVSDPVRQTVTETFYPLVFIYTLVSLLLTRGQLSLTTIWALMIAGAIYTCYAYIFGSGKWLYGANLALDVAVLYGIFWLEDLLISGGSPYLITGYLGLSTVALCYLWTYVGKRYEAQGELPARAYLKSFTKPHFFMAWAVLPIFIALMSGLFLILVPSPPLLGVSLHLITLGGLTALYVWLTGTRRQEIFLYLSEIGLASMIFFMRLARPDYFAGGRIALWLALISFVLMELGDLTQKYHVHMLVRLSYYTALLLPLMSLMLITPWEVTGYGVLSLLTIAGFYFWVSYLQSTGPFIYISLAVGNLGLFMLWLWRGLTPVYSLQLYGTPLALTAIGVAWLNKNSLSHRIFAGIQFFSTLCVLTVSYFEMLLIDESWRVDFLTALCLAGVLFGLAWRIKVFLCLGTLFLGLNFLTQLLFYLYQASWLIWGILGGLGLLSILGWILQNNKLIVLHLIESTTRELSTWE